MFDLFRSSRSSRSPRSQRVRRTSWILIALIGLASVFATAPATADPWGTGGSDTGAHPDIGPHTWCYGPTYPSDYTTAVTTAMNTALAGETSATVTYHSTCNLDGSSQTDVKWGALDLSPAGLRGQTRCAVYNTSNGRCDRNNITMDFAEINIGANDGADRGKTACHELGHSVGLTHGSTYGGCMISGEVPNTQTQWQRYSSHHKGHINAWFS